MTTGSLPFPCPTRVALLPAMFVLAAGCGADRAEPGDSEAGALPGQRDSAGVTVVTHSLEQLRAAPLLEADTVPELVIGAADGPRGSVLHEPRIVTGRSDGAVVVADDGATVLRLYDAEGRHVASHGREGEGPGEYRAVSALGWLPGDSLVAYDVWAGRADVLDPELRRVRSMRLPDGLSMWTFPSFGAIHDLGTGAAVILATGREYPTRRRPRPDPPSRVDRDTALVLALRPDGDELVVGDTVLDLPDIPMKRWGAGPIRSGSRRGPSLPATPPASSWPTGPASSSVASTSPAGYGWSSGCRWPPGP